MIDFDSLQNYEFFGGLSPSEIDQIKPFLNRVDFAKGTIIFRENELNDRIYFIMSGVVEIKKNSFVLDTVREGRTVGEMEFLNIMPAAATMTCLEDTSVAVITNHELYSLSKINIRVFSMIIMNLARDMARRLYRMDELVCNNNIAQMRSNISNKK